MSFSTSLPTMQYYSWLFGNGIPNVDTNHPQPLLGTASQAHTGLSQPLVTTTAEAHINDPQPLSGTTSQAEFTNGATQDGFQVDGMPNYLSSPSRQGATSELGMIGRDSPHLYFSPSRQPTNIADTPAHFSHDLPPPDACIRRSTTKAPVITNEARDGLMQLISQARPVRPDKSEITSSDPLLSLLSLQQCSDLFFERFNSTYPLIHGATFESSMVHPLLLMSIILLGATYGDKDAHLLAVCIHDVMRPLIHGSKDFGPRPKLWMLQTIMLVECFGKSRAGESQHDMSNIYHGLQINLLRRSDCHNANIPAWDESNQSLDEYWHMAIEAEEKRRLAMISFMWDTQHAILFAQILCLNASELKVTLPWDTAIWEATTAEEWLRLTRASPAPQQYLNVLQMYTDSCVSSAPLHLNALSRVLIFHGLMSLSWDFRRRDQTALNRDTPSNGVRWQTTISACYTKWKTDFDRYTKDVLSSLSNDSAQYAKFQRYAVANSAVYHTAQLILEVETADLQIHAGAKHITGRPVSDLDRQRSRARLNEFITRDEGKSVGRAGWHAARLIRDGVRKLDNWNVDDMIHFPWCLYLATLTCWAIQSSAIESRIDGLQKSLHAPMPPDRGLDDEDDVWDSETDMKALISALSRLDPASDTFAKDIWSAAGNHRPHGLLTCMVRHLSTIRWAVIREGMIVLKHLVAYQVR
ncbi:hypothetical protein LTR10_017696 [Elasticomyces elasticus]|uniref:Xylanolytic transcriptional activator regulatory domain-containing protein n=1 Tax=Exophiala sideris TaxID=1016849 RepID=A0ABR0JBS3_9EURO|nr:hypothetical protein LTR10_017696 [Elasticomyces elasticus]KAK5031055.1 hypothetical protein LTS07_004790 [Exophiala sideris]KAK5038777.1 hypothetical protein LTR13_003808 [Exophiala sideris]KAK5060660.1 hypothetical protein LTR69_005259 [Exophiala sideris]KAK5183573.1 hypothetical protein LTR44_003855 [Eurotiomycetes sp. CCFEE 6388]